MSKELETRSKIGLLKAVFTNGYWLFLSLTGAFFSFFALNRGGVVVFIEAGFFFVLLNLLVGEYRLKQIPPLYWISLAICLILIISGYLSASHAVKFKSVMYLIRMFFLVITIHCLSLKKIDPYVVDLLPVLWCFSISWQFVAVKYFNMWYGTYTNPHYLSNFLILILPLISFSFWYTEGWYKWILIPFALMAIDLLLKTESRPAILGLTFSSLFVLIFFVKSRIRWIGLLLIGLSFGVVYLTNYGGAVDHLKELIGNLRTEERVYLWESALQMLKNNNLADWVFGNGIGGYRAVYAEYSPSQFKHTFLFFPHLHPLGILYDNGIIGLILVFGGLASVFILTIKAFKNLTDKGSSILIKSMLVIFLSWMIHSSLAFPFYSKYAQYPLGFILGIMLVLIDRSNLFPNNKSASEKS